MSINKEYDVVIIGGGITGAGTARDCAMRGLSTLLVERFDLAAGASGRNHGLLHSGARYAVTDSESASECISENMILRRIARHCVEPTEGLFITLPEDDLEYQARFVASCRAAGISAEVIDPELARRMEPSVNPDIIGAVKVPDGSVDPFRLTVANVRDACMHGADVLTFTEVTGIVRENGRVCGVTLRDHRTGEDMRINSRMVVNAGGIWGQRLAEMVGAKINMFPAKGALLVFGHRVNNMVINRCRKPADADILVPGDTVCIIGTTSSRVPYDTIDSVRPTAEEVDLLLAEGAKLAPELASTRVLRAYAGVRPLVASDDDPSGRSISRGIVLLDHEVRDGIPGMITITGGKLMTYRLMAEKATDLVCSKFRIDRKCVTATTPLPGSESEPSYDAKSVMSRKAAVGRQGTMANYIDFDDDNRVVCECENVSMAEIRYAVGAFGVRTLQELRRRTRVGMGTCQGAFCIDKAARALAEALGDPSMEKQLIGEYLRERWEGMSHVCWGDTLREAEYMRRKYADEI